MKNTLDIIIDSLSDEEWNELRLKVDTKKTFERAKVYKAKRESAIGFADWILEQNVAVGYDQNGSSCWVVADGEGNTYNSLELFNIYIRGDWDEYEDEETEN
jgi:hypothetical protein